MGVGELDFDPYKGSESGLDFDPWKEEVPKKPSYLEAAKVGFKGGLAGAARMYEIPFRPIVERFPKEWGITPEEVLPSEMLKPTEEEQRRVAELGIPGQLVSGAAGLPGAALKYMPLMRGAGLAAGALGIPKIAAAAGIFPAERAAEELVHEKKIPSLRELGEEAAVGGIFAGIEPLGRLARSAILSGTFSTQAFADTYAQTKDINQAVKAAVAPGVIGAGLGLLGPGRRERPIPGAGPPGEQVLQIPRLPESGYQMGMPGWPPPGELPYPVTPYGRGGAPVDMIWNAERGRFEPGDYFQATTAPERPIPPVPPQLPHVRGLPEGGRERYAYSGPEPTVTPDWVREGREFPPPQYPPVPYTPRITPPGPKIGPLGALGPPTPVPTLRLEDITPESLKIPLLEGKLKAVLAEAENLGGFSRDLIKRWAGVGSKRADQIADALVKAGLAEAVPSPPIGTMPFKFIGKFRLPGDDLRYAGEIQELREVVSRGEPAKKIGVPTKTLAEEGTVSWGVSYPPFMQDKGWTRKDVLAAIDRGMRGDDFKNAPNLKEKWEAVKQEARGIFRDRIHEERMARRKALREADPLLEREETIKSLTDNFDDEIMGFREELSDEGWPTEAINRAIEEVRARIESEKIPPDFDGIKKALADTLTQAEIDPVLSPVAKRQYMLPGEKIGVPFPEGRIPGRPTLKGTPLSEGLPGPIRTLFDQVAKEKPQATFEELLAEAERRRGEIDKIRAKFEAPAEPPEPSPIEKAQAAARKIEIDEAQPKLFGREAELAALEKAKGALAPTDQPWRLTLDEFIESRKGGAFALEPFEAAKIWNEEVQNALLAGENVPDKVLKELGPRTPPVSKFKLDDPVKTVLENGNEFKGLVREIDEDGTIRIGSPDGKMVEASPDKVGADVPHGLPAVMADGELLIGSKIHGDIPPERYSEAKDVRIGWIDKEGNFTEVKTKEPKLTETEPPPIDYEDPKAYRKFAETKSGKTYNEISGKEHDALKKEFDENNPRGPAKMGKAYVKDQVRYFTDSEEIAKGKDKGKVRITLTDGKKVVVSKEDITKAPEFMTGEKPVEPLSREAVQGFAQERLKILRNAPEVEIVDMADIPERLSNQLDENLRKGIKGIYDPTSKKIFLIRDMMGSEQDVIGVIEHEAVGHYAMEAILGKDGEPFFNRVYMKYGKEGLKDIADQRGFDLNTKEGRLNAAKEKMAQLTETGKDPGLIKQFFAWIREQLRRFFPDLKLSDGEIGLMIKRAREYLINGEEKAREANVDVLKRQVRGLSGVTLDEPALFSVVGRAKEVGRAAYEEEVKPKVRGLWTSWDAIKKAFAPIMGVDIKDLDAMMKMKGDRALLQDKVDILTEKAMAQLNKMGRDEQINFIDRIQTGDIYGLPPDLKTIERLHRSIEDSLWAEANIVLKHMDEPSRIAYLENHVRNFWKVVPKGLMDEINRKGFSGLWRRPLEGTKAPLHHQYWTLKEGIENGGVPFTTNLMEITRLNYADTMKLITAQKMWDVLLKTDHRKFIKFGETLPEGFRAINDRIANQYFRRKFDDTELRRTALSDPDPVKRAEAAVTLNRIEQEGIPAEYGRGRWVVEENVARLLENYLSRDLVRETPFLRGVMGVKNVTTALELGFSAFHAVFETIEAAASQMGVGFRKVFNQGMIMEGLKDITTSPKAAVDFYKTGVNWERLMRDPQTFINTTKGQNFVKMFPQAADDIGWLYWGGGSMRMNESYRINSINTFRENINSKNYIGAALRSIPALSQFMMKPLFETYIPALKRGMFLREFNFAKLERANDLLAGKITQPSLAREVWRSVEDRFGEMNFDNLWWDRTFKSSLQMVVRSVTWKLGNIRQFGKAVSGQSGELISALREGRMPRLTQEMAWAWGVVALTTAMAYVTQKAFTGKDPENWQDLAYPQIDNQGGRISLPTYLRDFFHLGHAPLRYVGSSMAGWFWRITEVLNNKDFYGVQIHDPNENFLFRKMDDLVHMVPLPFSVQSMRRWQQEGEPGTRQVIGFLGGTKAPYWIERTDAEQKASELKAAHLPIGGRSTKDFQRGQLLKNYTRRYQDAVLKGESTQELLSQMHVDIRTGKLYMSDLLRFRDRIRKEPLIYSIEHLPIRDALEVWSVASEKEKGALAPILVRKYMGLRSPEDKILYMPKIQQILQEMKGGYAPPQQPGRQFSILP
jgi:hypothetical protein